MKKQNFDQIEALAERFFQIVALTGSPTHRLHCEPSGSKGDFVSAGRRYLRAPVV